MTQEKNRDQVISDNNLIRKVMNKPSKSDWKKLAVMQDKDIDLSDIEELNDDFFRQAIQEGISDADAGRVIDQTTLKQKWKSKLAIALERGN